MNKLLWRYEDRITWKEDKLMDSDIDITDFLEPCTPQTSSWWSGLETYMDPLARNTKEYFGKIKEMVLEGRMPQQQAHDKLSSVPKTAKACPGIHGLFKHSYLVKCPCDVHITLNKHQMAVAATPTDPALINIRMHTRDQFKSKHDLFENKFNLKFDLPVCLGTKNGIPYTFFDPMYHVNNPWRVMPGVIDGRYTSGCSLVVQTIVDINDPNVGFNEKGYWHFMVKKGQPLAYLWVPERTKLEYAKVPRLLNLRF